MQVIGYTNARNTLKSVIEKVVKDQAPILIHHRDAGNAVLLSEAAYASMQETLYLLSTPANACALLDSIAELKAGKAKTAKHSNAPTP